MQFRNTLIIIINMDNNILSPTSLWADYDANAVKLKANFLKYETDGKNVVNFEVYLSCDTDTDKDTPLIYCHGKIPKTDYKNATIIYINGYDSFLEEDVSNIFIPRGYGVISFDYMGKSPNRARYTIYPKSLEYANYAHSKGHLNSYVNSPKDSCVYIWSKMCRNVITFIKKLLGEDNKIYLRSSMEGGNILWQVAGTDKRVDGIIATNNAGWAEFKGLFRFSDSVDEFDFREDKLQWISACTPQAYAKFVTCPVLYLSGTNSNYTSVDRVEKSLELTANNGNNRVCLCANITNTIDSYATATTIYWLDCVYNGKNIPKSPKLTFEISEGKVLAKMEYDDSAEIDKLVVFYSYNEINSEFRHWDRILLSSANPVTQIPARYGDTKIFAFSSTQYKDGQSFSSLPQMLDLEKVKVDRIAPKRTRIVYERNQGLNAWAVDNITGASYMPELQLGAYDIFGVTARRGNLSTYYISDKNFERKETSILQFDCYCEKDRNLVVELSVETDDFSYESYMVNVKIVGGEWQKIALSHSDFKTKELVSLKDWNRVKKLSFVDINHALINNVIWI